MKFKGLRKFAGIDLQSVTRYLERELSVATKDLFHGLTRLSLTENFPSFEVTTAIPSGTEVRIENRLATASLRRLIVRQSGDGPISDGSTAWTKDFVYLENHGADDVTATVIFMR
jgi:hypothetical protein